MASNPYVNKVIFGNDVLIDLTSDTVTAADILTGKTAHDKSGAPITGTCDFDSDTTDADASASEILYGQSAYVNKNKLVGTMPNRGGVTGSISTVAGEYTIQEGYHDGSGKVAIDSTEQAKIIPSNILQGVTILGVQGSVEPSSDVRIESSKTATPYTTSQTILPSSGYDAIAEVTIAAITKTETDNASGGKTVQIGDLAPS